MRVWKYKYTYIFMSKAAHLFPVFHKFSIIEDFF